MLSSTVHHWQKCKISAKRLDKIAARKTLQAVAGCLAGIQATTARRHINAVCSLRRGTLARTGLQMQYFGPCSVPSRQCLQLKSSVSERQKCPLHPTAMSSNSSPSSSSFFTAAWTGLPYNSPHALYTAVRLSQTARMPRKT